MRVADGLSTHEAVAIALFNNPGFQASLATLGFSLAELEAAGALPNPVLSLLFPLGPKQLELTASWDISFLWKRPGRVAIAKLNVESVAEDLVEEGLGVAHAARLAFIGTVEAERRRALGDKARKVWTRIAHIADVRLAANAINELEARGIRTDAAAAALDADQREHDVVLARQRLEYVLSFAPARSVPLSVAPMPARLPDEPELLRLARAARPELRAAELRLEAAGRRAGLATAEVFQLSAVLDANQKGTEGFEMGPGVSVTLPLFNWNGAGRMHARAEVERAGYAYLEVRQRVNWEVKRARTGALQALDALERWPRLVREPREQNVALAERAFELGATNHLAVLDATRRLVEAEGREAELDAQARRALADLSRAVGKDFDAAM